MNTACTPVTASVQPSSRREVDSSHASSRFPHSAGWSELVKCYGYMLFNIPRNLALGVTLPSTPASEPSAFISEYLPSLLVQGWATPVLPGPVRKGERQTPREDAVTARASAEVFRLVLNTEGSHSGYLPNARDSAKDASGGDNQ